MEKDLNTEITRLKAQLAEVEQEKQALFKIISHDLRSPMNKLYALIGLIKMSEQPLSDEQTNYLDKMELVISDGLNKMRNLMDLRAIEGAGIDTLIEPVNLGRLVSKIILDEKPLAGRKQITIDYSDNPLVIETDKHSCQRIIEHLLTNAVKYSPTGSTIRVAVEKDEDEVRVSVVDGGYGIADEEQKQLFKKFTVLSTRPTGSESSTGIGLYIAQWLANNIGGKISYTNKGESRFVFHLPQRVMA